MENELVTDRAITPDRLGAEVGNAAYQAQLQGRMNKLLWDFFFPVLVSHPAKEHLVLGQAEVTGKTVLTSTTTDL